MISLREEELTKNQESSTSYSTEISKASSASSTTSWSKLKDPRIVRVSRSFGGKDRHSKVYTVRGLRDRRIRLSVHTAIQLYDLQERLGLNQPSKVVDWLLNVAKNEIDTLPPLQFPQGSSFNPMVNSFLGKSKEFSGETSDHRGENWENQGAFVSTNNLVSRQNPSSLLNGIFPYNPSDLTLYHPPRNHGLTAQPEDLRDFGLVPLPSTLYQPGMSTQSYFHPQTNAIDQELEQKQLHFQSLQLSSNSHFTSTTQPIRSFPFNMTANLLPSQNNSSQNKDSEFHRR